MQERSATISGLIPDFGVVCSMVQPSTEGVSVLAFLSGDSMRTVLISRLLLAVPFLNWCPMLYPSAEQAPWLVLPIPTYTSIRPLSSIQRAIPAEVSHLSALEAQPASSLVEGGGVPDLILCFSP